MGWLSRLLARAGLPRRRESAGRRGEREAERHLAARGLRILERNVRARRGEIDLIARDGDTLVFVEVKSWTAAPGLERSGLERLDGRKRRALARSCRLWLRRSRQVWVGHRLDLVAVELEPGEDGKVREVRWYPAVMDV